MANDTHAASTTADTKETPKQVQSALAWQLPMISCNKPKPPGVRKEVFDDDGIRREEWDVDYYTLKRYKRKERRWEACVDDYKAGLAKSFTTLKNSAQYGLTQPQADIILGKMKAIQLALQSPEGVQP